MSLFLRVTPLALFASVALAQTTTPASQHPVHRAATGTRAATFPAAKPNPADNPPNVPPVSGSPRPLFALRYVDTQIGTGDLAAPEMYYTVRYTGWLTDGTKFDSSEDHPGKEPITFPYGAHRVIAGWDTGFEGMHVGGKRRLYIPYQMAYGLQGRPPVIPPKADLIFDIELVSQSSSPPTPPPAQTPPATATPPPQGTAPETAPAPPPGSVAPGTTPQTTRPETTPQR